MSAVPCIKCNLYMKSFMVQHASRIHYCFECMVGETWSNNWSKIEIMSNGRLDMPELGNGGLLSYQIDELTRLYKEWVEDMLEQTIILGRNEL